MKARVIWISSLLTPFHVAFVEESNVSWKAMECTIDLIFFMDVVFSFISAYYNRMEILISDRKQIALGYLKSWFLIDLIAIIPLELVTNSMINQMGKMARLPRVYKLMKTAK